eukprot:2467-Heterococcus_DN1.PRE.2
MLSLLCARCSDESLQELTSNVAACWRWLQTYSIFDHFLHVHRELTHSQQQTPHDERLRLLDCASERNAIYLSAVVLYKKSYSSPVQTTVALQCRVLELN